MLQRVVIHLSLILLFAITQIGIATHEISHLSDNEHHQQQDQDHHKSQCEQCLSYSHAADSPLAYSTSFDATANIYRFTTSDNTSVVNVYTRHYSARAPPAPSKVA